ncbi:MAG: purine-nucleoside phosphorylase [Muribaculaceae bacterium]|nr:purine-nucleoside phosphorylase [Muribaculaceae bacterium]MBQ9586048.1 purine-nucleoside phosphorylase [Muribaculaceae bacterium]
MTKEINWLEKIQETAAFLKEKVGGEMPKVAIVLGSGLGNLANKIDVNIAIPYGEIPNFPVSTVEGHKGQLIFGKLGKKYVMAMQGRFHYYEGYSMKEATFPIRVMKAIGVKVLCVSNAAGGMNPDFRVGDVMLITDHINLFPDHPLRGKNYNELGPRFPAMNEAYSHRIIDLARNIAKENKIRLMEGVYVGTQGPTFETPSEYRYFYRIGGDAVGMSTVPEVIVARHADMEVFGLSVITDLGGEGIFVDVSHEEVQQAATKAEPIMTLMVQEVINRLDEV